MNRVFKFRAWETVENKMYYQVRVGGVFDGEPTAPTTYIKGKGWVNLTGGDYTKVMQYIGFKDCNGKEIYESDILKITWGNGKIVNYKVEYLSECGYYILIDINNKEDDEIICIFDSSQIEVVGNIFETPKLTNKILELCEDRPIITGIGINTSPKSPKPKFPEETYLQVNNIDDNKRFFDGYKPKYYFKTDRDLICDKCNCNPENGGSGICNCTLATYKSY